MIPEERLREAAAEYSEAWIKAVEQDYDPARQHVFSPGFQRKIRRLKHRADHPVFYRALRSAAALLLSLLIGSGAWLVVDAEARAAFVGWVKEVWEEYFVFRFEGDADSSSSSAETIHYRPTWLPEGYTEFFVDENADFTLIIYANGSNQMLKFNYSHNPNNVDFYIDTTQTTTKQANINGILADLLIGNSSENASAIFWTTENNTVFYISAHLNEHELIRIAENIKKIN